MADHDEHEVHQLVLHSLIEAANAFRNWGRAEGHPSAGSPEQMALALAHQLDRGHDPECLALGLMFILRQVCGWATRDMNADEVAMWWQHSIMAPIAHSFDGEVFSPFPPGSQN